MKITTSYSSKKNDLSENELKEKQLNILLNNLFNLPRYDNNYFYYTEVFSDWVTRK